MTRPADDDLGRALLIRARNAIALKLDMAVREEPPHEQLAQQAATFVTLMLDGRLRGCIGTLEAWRSTEADVRANAHSAAFSDPRFPPLDANEYPRLKIEVSLLDPPQPMSFRSEADALKQLRPHVDGVILIAGLHRATYLPQVWEQLPDPALFLASLKQKARLPATAWPPGIELHRYTVRKWKEA